LGQHSAAAAAAAARGCTRVTQRPVIDPLDLFSGAVRRALRLREFLLRAALITRALDYMRLHAYLFSPAVARHRGPAAAALRWQFIGRPAII